MRVASAIALIENLVYKPGWEILVEDYTHRFEDTICVTMCCDTYRSERDQAEQGYPEAIRPRASFCIPVGDITDDVGLYRALLSKIIAYETHEAREFLRVKPTMWAPFNPHQTAAMERFATTPAECTCKSSVGADLAFGMV
jgi:hypothetical protein